MVKELIISKTGGVFLIAISIVLSACAPAASASAFYAPSCPPPTSEGNVYRQTPQSILSAYYSTAFTNMDFNNPENVQRYETIQYEAIKLLATKTERWSAFIDIPLGNKYVRITITYLSPELVQTIILNQYLFGRISDFLSGFDTEVLAKMDSVASRNEHIFLITLTASQYEEATSYNNPVIVRLPLQSLVMTNSANIRVIPQHDDHNLEERIDLTHSSAYGYIAYPMAATIRVNENETCVFLLDKATNTHLTLSIPYIEINGTRHETRPWMLEYAPLLKIVSNPNQSITSLQVERTPEHFRPDNEPPVWMATENAEYWEKLGRFIWYEATLDP